MKPSHPKPKSSFQPHLSLLQNPSKPPFRSKTPPNLLPNNSKVYVNTTVNYDDDSDDQEKDLLTKSRQYTECNSNSSRRLPSKNTKKTGGRMKKDDVLRFSLENNKNLAWNDIAKLLNNTQKKEIKPKNNGIEPKCLYNQTFKPKNEKNEKNINEKNTLNKYSILRRSLNQKAENSLEIENIPVVHENFENIVNNYMNNQKNPSGKPPPSNIRHSFEGISIEKLAKNAKNEENDKIKCLNGKKLNFFYFFLFFFIFFYFFLFY